MIKCPQCYLLLSSKSLAKHMTATCRARDDRADSVSNSVSELVQLVQRLSDRLDAQELEIQELKRVRVSQGALFPAFEPLRFTEANMLTLCRHGMLEFVQGHQWPVHMVGKRAHFKEGDEWVPLKDVHMIRLAANVTKQLSTLLMQHVEKNGLLDSDPEAVYVDYSKCIHAMTPIQLKRAILQCV
jgi:hypothetical protein